MNLATRIAVSIILLLSLSKPVVAQTARELGIAAVKQQDYQQAIEKLQKSKVEGRAVPDLEVEAYLALAYQKVGLQDAATKYLELLDNYQTEVDDNLQAKIHSISGLVLSEQQNYPAAIAKFNQAKQLYPQNSSNYLGNQINIAVAMQKLGKFRHSANILKKVQEKLSDSSTPSLNYLLQHNLALAETRIGNYQQAKSLFEQAGQNDINKELQAQNLIAYAKLISTQEPDKSLAALEQAIKLGNLTSRIEAQLTVAKLKSTTNDNTISQIETDIANLPPTSIKDQYQLKLIEYLLSKNQKANQRHTQILEAISSKNNHRDAAMAYGLLGKIYLTDKPKQALSQFQKAIKSAEKAAATDLSYQWNWEISKLTKNRQKSQAYLKKAVTELNVVRSNLIGYSTEELRNYEQLIEPIYRDYVSTLLETPNQENLSQARDTVENLQTAELENYFRSACLTVDPKKIDEIDEKAATIYTIILEDRLAVITSIKDELIYKSFNVTPAEIAQKTAQFTININPSRSRRRREAIGKEIYSWLVGANREKFAQNNINSLVFVLDKELRNLPLAALNTDTGYLIEDYVLSLTPGLQLLPSQTTLDGNNLEAVAGGLSEEQQGFGALPGVAKELANISQIVTADTLLNEKFTERNLQESLKQTKDAPLLHLATHGQFSSDPEETYILTWENRLDINELETLLKIREETPKLVAIELLILSACKTATGDQEGALGLAGMAVRSGARSTIGSLWSIPDQSTTVLVEELYQQLKLGKDKGEVLRQAQLALLNSEQFNHPYFWSPYVLVGNWN